jgi:hypothetical protein
VAQAEQVRHELQPALVILTKALGISAMSDADEIKGLLREMLDTQKQHLEEYRRVSSEALTVQRRAVEQQSKVLSVQRIAPLAIAIGAVILALAAYLQGYFK